MNIILELKAEFNIIFIQEPFQLTICSISSSRNCEGESLVGVVNHPNWLTFSRSLETESDYPRVVTYVNIRLISLCFALHKDVICQNHRKWTQFLFISSPFPIFFLFIFSLFYFQHEELGVVVVSTTRLNCPMISLMSKAQSRL